MSGNSYGRGVSVEVETTYDPERIGDITGVRITMRNEWGSVQSIHMSDAMLVEVNRAAMAYLLSHPRMDSEYCLNNWEDADK